MQSVVISQQTRHILDSLEPDGSVERKVERLAEQELLRRLARYQLTDYTLRRKYNMTFAEFEAANVVEKQGFSFEVESDHQDWDLADDGIRTIEGQLAQLRGDRHES